MENDLLREVQDSIKARKGEWKRIAADVPEVSYSWIAQMGRGKYHSAPSHERLMAIATYLRKAPSKPGAGETVITP